VQFTIEARELTIGWTRRIAEPWANRTIVEAPDANDAIAQFVRANDSELVSFLKPAEGRESIATVRKNDAVFLVRVYEA